MKTQPQSFRIAAKQRMVALGLTTTELAKKLNLARNTVSLAINKSDMFQPTKAAIRRELGL